MRTSVLCEVENVSVLYPKSHAGTHEKKIVALNSVSLRIELGQRIGVIGLNGAGKTTLLKILAGILPPTLGKVHIASKVSPILNTSLGLDMRLNGRDNVISRLMLQGMSREKAQGTVKSIASWTELESRVLDPISTYSAGMRARLAFALNTELNAGLLLIDEGINAGDASFQLKAKERLKTFLNQANSLVIASHSISYLNDFATKLILMNKGEIVSIGENQEIIDLYNAQILSTEGQKVENE